MRLDANPSAKIENLIFEAIDIAKKQEVNVEFKFEGQYVVHVDGNTRFADALKEYLDKKEKKEFISDLS
jgi:hypothetical protein